MKTQNPRYSRLANLSWRMMLRMEAAAKLRRQCQGTDPEAAEHWAAVETICMDRWGCIVDALAIERDFREYGTA